MLLKFLWFFSLPIPYTEAGKKFLAEKREKAAIKNYPSILSMTIAETNLT